MKYSRQALLHRKRDRIKVRHGCMFDVYEPGDLPEFYECMGYTKKEWEDMTNPANM